LAIHCTDGEELATATGFLVACNRRLFVVTNWHVVAGLSPITNMPLWRNKPPARVTVYTHKVVELGNQTIQQFPTKFECSLLNQDSDNNSGSYSRRVWFEHPTHGKSVDIAAFEVTNTEVRNSLLSTHITAMLNEDLVQSIDLNVMDELFVIGFPKVDRAVSGDFPIYKSATVASEPRVTTNRLCFYVDSKTKEGMSGSLVIMKMPMIPSLKGAMLSFGSGATEPVGIYSGRDFRSNSGLEAELGIVWPISLVNELIAAI